MIINQEYEKQFTEAMDKLGKMHENSKVYVDFMDYYIYQNSESPDRRLPIGYKESEMQLFQEAYNGFCEMMKQLIQEHGWYDFLGEYYEEYVLAQSKGAKKGQFFTPRQISDLLSRMVGSPMELADAYDPACGSARNLLDYHCKHPEVRLTGEDLDESACKMAVINFHCHGVDGVVNWIDALTREYMGVSWRILEGQIYITDLDWIRSTDELMDAVSILLLSDDTIKSLLEVAAKAYKDANDGVVDVSSNPSTDSTGVGVLDTTVTPAKKEEKKGLDDWL